MVDLHRPDSITQSEHYIIQMQYVLEWWEIISTNSIQPLKIPGLVDVLSKDD